MSSEVSLLDAEEPDDPGLADYEVPGKADDEVPGKADDEVPGIAGEEESSSSSEEDTSMFLSLITKGFAHLKIFKEDVIFFSRLQNVQLQRRQASD